MVDRVRRTDPAPMRSPDTPYVSAPNARPRAAPAPTPAPTPTQPSEPRYETMRDSAIRGYQGKNFGYNPYTTSKGPDLLGMNFNPYRQAASNAASSQAAGALTSYQSSLQQAGGLSGSDRMKAFSDFNRQKILGTLGANAKYDQAQSQNQMDVGRYNAERAFDVQKANLEAQNTAARDLAQANLRREENLYGGAMSERDLQRQLEAARIISESQMKGQPVGFMDKLEKDPWGTLGNLQKRAYDPLNVVPVQPSDVLGKMKNWRL